MFLASSSKRTSARSSSAASRFGFGAPRQQDQLPAVPGALPAPSPVEELPMALPMSTTEQRRLRQDLGKALDREAQLCGFSAHEAYQNKGEADVPEVPRAMVGQVNQAGGEEAPGDILLEVIQADVQDAPQPIFGQVNQADFHEASQPKVGQVDQVREAEVQVQVQVSFQQVLGEVNQADDSDGDDVSVESRDPDAPRTACRPIWSAQRARVPPLAATSAPSAANYLMPDVVIGDGLDEDLHVHEAELLTRESEAEPLAAAPPAFPRAAAAPGTRAPRHRHIKPAAAAAAAVQPARVPTPPAAPRPSDEKRPLAFLGKPQFQRER